MVPIIAVYQKQIKYQSFAYTQLNVKQFYLTHR